MTTTIPIPMQTHVSSLFPSICSFALSVPAPPVHIPPVQPIVNQMNKMMLTMIEYTTRRGETNACQSSMHPSPPQIHINTNKQKKKKKKNVKKKT